jgi:hypothetical protein
VIVTCDAEQLDLIYRAAALLTPQERANFMRAVASRLEGHTPVARAVRFILEARHGIAVGRHVLAPVEMQPRPAKHGR